MNTHHQKKDTARGSREEGDGWRGGRRNLPKAALGTPFFLPTPEREEAHLDVPFFLPTSDREEVHFGVLFETPFVPLLFFVKKKLTSGREEDCPEVPFFSSDSRVRRRSPPGDSFVFFPTPTPERKPPSCTFFCFKMLVDIVTPVFSSEPYPRRTGPEAPVFSSDFNPKRVPFEASFEPRFLIFEIISFFFRGFWWVRSLPGDNLLFF